MLPPSLRRRGIAAQSLRQSQPPLFFGGFSPQFVQSGFATTITASATTHTKGAWTQLISSLSAEASAVLLWASGNSVASTNTAMLVDIGVGATSSESVVVPDIALGGANGFRTFIPVRIASGSRIAARCQCANASQTISLGMVTLSQPFPDRVPTVLDSLGTNTATSAGTAMTGASGQWTQLVASTAKDYQALVLVPSCDATAGANNSVRLSLGIGGSGSESEIGFTITQSIANPSVSDGTVSSTVTSMFSLGVASRFIPAGTRIAVRHNLAANPSRISACVLGVPYV